LARSTSLSSPVLPAHQRQPLEESIVPFVFVHGVNTRAGSDYDRAEKLRNAFLREIVAPAVGIAPASTIRSPYWGSEGVRFWRDLAVVPGEGGVETFGAQDRLPPSIGIALAERAIEKDDGIEAIARKAPEVAVDLLWDYAASAATGDDEFTELARAYRRALARLGEDGGKDWLRDTRSPNLADDVYTAVMPPAGETFGGGGLFGMLEEAAKRIAMKPADLAAQAAVALGRKPLTRTIATFIGDAFQYLAERGDGSVPGAITRKVLDQLLAARDEAIAAKEPLVVICHSFGGEIVYDILTHYAPALARDIDAWVTVGSQVGLFEEMSLLWASTGRRAPRTAIGTEAIASPEGLKRWINIADGNDVFGFLVLPVFTGATPGAVEDFMYDTGYPVAGAHSGYFEWPSFYKRLASRLGQP
jgi:hypothetical protein